MNSIPMRELHPGAVPEMLALLGVCVDPGQKLPDMPLAERRIRAGQSLFFEGAPATSIYVVRAGTFKAFHTAEDGYEQVFGFARRGDLLGCDALSGDGHLMGTVALEDASVYVVALPDFYALAQSLPAFHRGVVEAPLDLLAVALPVLARKDGGSDLIPHERESSRS